jgi:hypothetical protein
MIIGDNLVTPYWSARACACRSARLLSRVRRARRVRLVGIFVGPVVMAGWLIVSASCGPTTEPRGAAAQWPGKIESTHRRRPRGAQRIGAAEVGQVDHEQRWSTVAPAWRSS